MLELRVLGTTDLRRTDGTRVHSVLAQPKRFALLAYLLLVAPGSYVRRDSLLALFWPESDEARARAALRKAIHYLRQSLGADIIVGRGSDELGVDTAQMDCDALRVRRLLKAGRLEEALEAYGGELLPGFYIDGPREFDEWLEAERASIRRSAANGAAQLARRAHQTGDRSAAASWQCRAHEIAPADADVLRDALVLLIEAGQRSAAGELLAAHRKRCDDIGIAPDPDLEALFERRTPPPPALDVATAATAAPPRVPASPEPLQRPGRRRMRWLIPAAAAGAVLVAILRLAPGSDGRAAIGPASPLVAVGSIRDFTGGADSIGRVIPDLLATNLSRAPRVRVVSSARLHEAVAGAGADVRQESAVAAAARAVGANELVEGALYRLPDGRLRLDLRRLRVSDGQLLHTYRVTGSDPFELVDRTTATLSLDIGGVADRDLRVADVTTRSLVALRFYQEGLVAYFGGDTETARHFFDAALGEDSTFAMAAYFGGLASASQAAVMHRYLDTAERLAHRTTDRERLMIRATRAFYRNDPDHLAIADSLVTLFPGEPAGHLLYGRSLIHAGRFAEALVPLRRALELDSLSLLRETGSCRACQALLSLGTAYLYMDSAAAAERVVRRAYDARSASHAFAAPLAYVLQANAKYAEADERLRLAGQGVMTAENVALGLIRNDIRRGEFARADAALRGFIDTSSRNLRSSGRWLLIISLRHQGRLDEALAVIAEERNDPGRSTAFPPMDVLTEATVRLERGDFSEAAALFGSLAAMVPRDGGEAFWSRNTAWNLTHAANAYAGAGRLDRLEALAERVRVVGARSGYGRDPRLHHHIRGLLAAARGDRRSAVAEYRAAVFSVASGYTRTNVELARALLAVGEPEAAVAVLDPPLRNGGLDAMMFYATRTEMHALLGEAYLRSGRPDLARAHLDQALDAWQSADASFTERITHLETLRELAL